VIADVVFGQQDEVVGVGVLAAGFVEVAAGSDVGFDAHNGLDIALFGLFIELDRAPKSAVVGDCDGVHAELFHAVEHVRYLLQPVEQAVVGVVV
jgi:hypothetical protein